MAHTIQRLTIYALIIAIEEDCRDFISLYISPSATDVDVLDQQTFKKAKERLEKDDAQAEKSINTLIQYIDLGDELYTIKRHENLLDDTTKKYISNRWKTLEKLLPVRNRVMHARPLELDDFAFVIDTSQDLVKSNNVLWAKLRTTIRELENNPSFVTTITIPYIIDDTTDILHNLPQVDFDDTGFVGREKELNELKKAIFGSYPVITVIGEGGLGKTSLALKACYDLLDSDNKRFDAIVWTTSKASKLTLTEIKHIEGAITSSLGIIEHAVSFLGRQNVAAPHEDLLQHLKNNKILLVIDNLETIIDNNIRDFVRDVPEGSKILFTTRIGLGAFDFPIKLLPLTKKDATFYFRRTAKAWGVEDFATANPQLVEELINKLQFNPLFIKWFIQGIRVGNRPASLTNNTDLLLRFCLQNVFAGLPISAQTIVKILACIAGPQTIAGLVYFSDIDSIGVQSALSILLTSNLISVERGRSLEDEDKYFLSPLARLYIQKFLHPPIADQKRYIHKQNVLRSAEEEFSSRQGFDIFDASYVFVRGRDDYIVARILTKIIDHIYRKRYEQAEIELNLALDLSPNYFEVRRVEAFLRTAEQNYFAASAAFEAAVSLAPDQAPLRMWFAGFLSRSLGDHDGALQQLAEAERLQPEALPIKLEKVRILQYQRKFYDATILLSTIRIDETVSSKNKRITFDLTIRSFTRQADDYISKDDPGNALDCLKKAMDFAQTIPPGLLDSTARQNLTRATRLLPRLREVYNGGPEQKQVETIAKWLYNPIEKDGYVEQWKGQNQLINTDNISENNEIVQENILYRGRIEKMHEKYGFISSGLGNVFFGRHSWIGTYDFSVLEEGNILEYYLEKTPKGLAAKNVRAVEPPAISNNRKDVAKGVIEDIGGNGGKIRLENGNLFYFDKKACLPGTTFKNLRRGEKVRIIFEYINKTAVAVELYSGL